MTLFVETSGTSRAAAVMPKGCVQRQDFQCRRVGEAHSESLGARHDLKCANVITTVH